MEFPFARSRVEIVGSSARPGRAESEAKRVMKGREWARLASGPEIWRLKRQMDESSLKLLEEFKQWARKRGHNRWRVVLSEYRILSPLVCHHRTFGIERGWHELTDRERKDFVRWGIARERVMLKVPPAGVRATELFRPEDDVLQHLTAKEREDWKRFAVGAE